MASNTFPLFSCEMAVDKNNLSFEEVYIRYSSKLIRFSKEYVISKEEAENIVHDVYAELWRRWDLFSGVEDPFAYLYVSVRNRSLDYLHLATKERKLKQSFTDEYFAQLSLNYETLDSFKKEFKSIDEIYELLEKAIDRLPEKCRIIFVKNKIEGIKQKDIADQLGISLNTVESQMAIAYSKLREELQDFFPLIIFLFIN